MSTFFLVVAQVFKKPHIANTEDCAKEIKTDLKPSDTSTGLCLVTLTSFILYTVRFLPTKLTHPAINSSTSITPFLSTF